MKYPYHCNDCNQEFEFEKPMKDEFPAVVECVICHGPDTQRVWETKPIKYNSDGFHNTDYGKYGYKQDLLRKRYEMTTGEPAPPPAKDVPRVGMGKTD